MENKPKKNDKSLSPEEMEKIAGGALGEESSAGSGEGPVKAQEIVEKVYGGRDRSNQKKA